MKRKAFTLVELLVVITLIALLAILLMPSFNTARTMYRATQCRNNLKRLWDGFILASDVKSSGDNVLSAPAPHSAGVYPTGYVWPGVPHNILEDVQLFQCPEDEVKQSSVVGSLKSVEYVSPFGHYPMDTIGNGNCYKSRRGYDAKGSYTEYIMQDDEGTGGQYAAMDFNGWIDTDGGCRIYDAGVIHVWKNIEQESPGSVPDWSGAHGGYPTGINTCGNQNDIWYNGAPSLKGNGRMQDARGQDFILPNWGEKLTNYGINSYAYRYSTGAACILLVDYQESMVDVDIPQESQSKLLQSARHFENVNYLLSDGSVKTDSPLEISPLLHPKAWRP